MQTLDFVSGVHVCLEFSQPLSCLYQAMQTRKTRYEGFSKLVQISKSSKASHADVESVLVHKPDIQLRAA